MEGTIEGGLADLRSQHRTIDVHTGYILYMHEGSTTGGTVRTLSVKSRDSLDHHHQNVPGPTRTKFERALRKL